MHRGNNSMHVGRPYVTIGTVDVATWRGQIRGRRKIYLSRLVDIFLLSRTNIFCKGSVDITNLGVDTMVQNKGRNVKKSPSQVDTRDLSQGVVLPVWESVSTHLMGRSTHSGISVT
ncbi:hypothetical protein Taro_002725 [Colocasia esculenta]|uniref:Uncharacterized protein n=1 Tax=Colocasia esculenta TaxID=4460 RepID=A0A843THD5_COLES|nr:hypothetical protein [Colocasia esculenta]